jgi:hypothetical protein
MGNIWSNLSFNWVRRCSGNSLAIEPAPATPRCAAPPPTTPSPVIESTSTEPPTTESPHPLPSSSSLNPTPSFTLALFQRLKFKYNATSAELESQRVWYEANKYMAENAQEWGAFESTVMKIEFLEYEKDLMWGKMERMLKSMGEGFGDEEVLEKGVEEKL